MVQSWIELMKVNGLEHKSKNLVDPEGRNTQSIEFVLW